MITIIFVFIGTLMISVMLLIHVFLLSHPIEEIYDFVISMYGGTQRGWLVFTLLGGLLLSIGTDLRKLMKKWKGYRDG